MSKTTLLDDLIQNLKDVLYSYGIECNCAIRGKCEGNCTRSETLRNLERLEAIKKKNQQTTRNS